MEFDLINTSEVVLSCFLYHNHRQYLLDTIMDWTGAAHTRSYGCAMLGILATVAMEIGQEALGFWKSLISRFL